MQYPDIAARLKQMGRRDHALRRLLLDKSKHESTLSKLDDLDTTNTQELKAIVRHIGWPTNTKVGQKAAHAAWLLIQHADQDIVFQKQCLALMKQENPDEVDRQHIAYLTDRIKLNEGKPQLYGTQFVRSPSNRSHWVPYTIHNPALVEKRRKHMGLNSLKESQIEINTSSYP